MKVMDDLPRIMLHAIAKRARRLRGISEEFDFDGAEIPSSERHRLHAEAVTDFARTFYLHEGRPVHKWTQYLDVYDRHLTHHRGTPVKFLEIGVFRGGSLELWRKYLGPAATIFGIDINPLCAERVDAPNQVRIGSQTDAEFLRRVVTEMGGVDVVLDDGSHVAKHQSASFATLFPLLSEGGLYMIEDMHTSYWAGEYFGGVRRKGTAVELVKEMIDDLHRWYHWERRPSHGPIHAVHAYDSLAVIEKRTGPPPKRIHVPSATPVLDRNVPS